MKKLLFGILFPVLALASGGGSTGVAPLASPTFTGKIGFGNYNVQPVRSALGNCGASKTVDLSTANFFTITLNAATCTLTYTNPQDGAAYLFKMTQDSTGSRAIAVTNGKFAGGSVPTLSAANLIDTMTCVYDGGATKYYCNVALNFN